MLLSTPTNALKVAPWMAALSRKTHGLNLAFARNVAQLRTARRLLPQVRNSDTVLILIRPWNPRTFLSYNTDSNFTVMNETSLKYTELHWKYRKYRRWRRPRRPLHHRAVRETSPRLLPAVLQGRPLCVRGGIVPHGMLFRSLSLGCYGWYSVQVRIVTTE